VLVAAAAVGLAAAACLSALGLSDLYGDGVAHLNIARKMVDARGAGLWERYVQLGSPWLPLPHLAALPFVWSDALWRSGWAGMIPSLAAYAAAAWLLYRLAFDVYGGEPAALLAAGAFALNPSALYLASTPMTEMPFAALVLASAYLAERWRRAGGASRGALAAAAAAVAALSLTRYEGWALVPAGAVVVALCSGRRGAGRASDVALWLAVASAGPLYWLWHNWAIYGDPLEFYRGPYSARAIFASQASRLGWAGFVVGSPPAALGWALLTVAVVAGPVTVALALAGLAVRAWSRGREAAADAPAALALVPFAFLVYSLFRGEVQIYPLAALALLNVRYGVPHVAAAALLLPALARGPRARAVLAAVAALVALQYAALAREGPSQLAVAQEAIRNSRNAAPWRERAQLAAWLAEHPPEGLVLMHAGELGPVVRASGLTFSRLVHEGTREWNEWSAAGAIPPGVATVVMREGDPVWARLGSDPEFASRFAPVYRDGPLQVWAAVRSP
jgi:4-amino-4-deoxy-L-arabinose transferase-like glycosyltransferase